MADRPYLLLDVDGVIVCDDGEPHTLPSGSTVRIAPAARALAEFGDAFECVWASAWEARADLEIGPLVGLRGLPHITFPDLWKRSGRKGRTAKLPDVSRHVGERPCVWLDDDFGPDAVAWAAERNLRGIRTTLVPTDPARGVAAAQLDELARLA
jgi:hypothetical protein